MASKTAAADPAPRATLLQCGAMPNYSVVNESKEEFSSLQERIERRVLLHQPQPTQLQLLQEKDLSEQAVLLHSIFCKFCHPKPSVASVLDILLLERQRVLIVNNNNGNNDDGNDEASAAHLAASRNILQILAQDDDYNQHLPMSMMHPSLPKEVLIHTSPNAAESIISILTCSAKSCLLKLPVHFQLAFCRILVRLLSDETDDEFDTECLFQFKDDADIHQNGRGGGEEQMNDGNGCCSESGERKRDDNQNIINDESSSSSSSSDDDDTYDIINRRQSTTFFNRPKSSSSSLSKLQRSNTNNNSSSSSFYQHGNNNITNSGATTASNNNNNSSAAYTTWNHARWKKKKSSPLYNVVRFCSNQQWGEGEGRRGGGANDDGSTNNYTVSNGNERRSKRWDYVADHVKLGYGEEDDISSSSSEDEDEFISNTAGDIAANLINIYNAILRKCSSDEHAGANNNGQYLLLGPVAHLIGLVCSTGVSVKNLRLLFVLAEKSSSSAAANKKKSKSNNVVSTLARLHILRALRYAAEYSTQSNGIHDKVGPQTFFSFGDGGPGLVETFHHTSWPFKYDFGMACWFRAETFVPTISLRRRDNIIAAAAAAAAGPNPVLFRAEIPHNGTRIEISFDTSAFNDPDSGDSNAATLIVTVVDARHFSNVPNTLRKIRLIGCVLSTQVWYHVAVRMNRSRMNRFSLSTPFSSKDELSIFLNGKLVLKEAMKMPDFADAGGGGSGVGSKLAKIGSGFSSFHKSVSSDKSAHPLEMLFFSNIEGQAGALYVFEQRISDDTIRALHRETASFIDQTYLNQRFRSFCGDDWDLDERKMCHLAKVMSASSLETELKDSVLPDFPELMGETSENRRLFFDCAEEDEADGIPSELSMANFGSKLFLVWDPRRVIERQVFDPHTSKFVKVGCKVCRWTFESIKDTIGSLGGVQRLMPLFWISNSATSQTVIGIDEYNPYMIIQSLLFLLASFIREHDVNCRELFRCGGAHVIEQVLSENKKEYDRSKHGRYGLGITPDIARCNASALLDLWQASRPIFALETVVFTRLLFNLPLLLGGVSRRSGVSFHAAMLPVLSELAMQNPEKVRDCVGTKELFDLVTEYSSIAIGDGDNRKENTLFRRAGPSAEDPLYLSERIFMIDVIFSIIAGILSERCTSQDLYPLITFITFNLDVEWEAASASVTSDSNEPTTKSTTNAYKVSLKAVSIFFFLLQKRPSVPNLIETLTDIFEHGNGVASWMLCCLVNSFDDKVRGLGIKCLAAYLQSVSSVSQNNVVRSLPSTKKSSTPSSKISNTMRYGMGIANNVLMSVLSGRDNTKVTYKLLWHLLKCHRERLGAASNAAILYLIVENGRSSSLDIKDIVVENLKVMGGSRLECESLLDNQLSKGGTFSISNSHGVGTLLRLLRFMPNVQKERWLFDLLAMTLASSKSVEAILKCDNEWQPCLFHLTGEVIEEITGGTKQRSNVNGERNSAVDTETLSKPSVRTRYDLSLKLYSTLLGHCVRKGDEKAFEAVEMAAALQRVDANGSEVFSILLSHLFAELIENGTIANVEATYTKSDDPIVKNRALKQSAKLVTQAILSNGATGLDMSSAVRQWRCLRHLTALTVAVVTDNGFGVVDLFDYRNQNASAVDSITGGMYGIRLDNLVSGINAFEALAGSKVNTEQADNEKMRKRARHRYVCVVLASQVLTLLDAFIFPDNLDSAKAASQLHGLSLVRSTEPRLGQSQGILLVSLVRLSLILLAYLEPSSVRFLQACSRLRCFLHWSLEIIRESVALGGYSVAFHELTAPLDRMVLVIVLHCHRALSRCSVVLAELESSPWDKYFSDLESRQKSHRRLFRAILELREIVLAAYRGRNEVLRTALSPQAHNALSRGLEEVSSPKKESPKSTSKEVNLRSFLESDWVSNFLDVDTLEGFEIPEQLANGQIHDKRKASTRGREAMSELISESKAIVKEYSSLLNEPFAAFCESQRKWAETDAVRDREYEGDLLVKKVSSKHRTDTSESNRVVMAQFALASQRMVAIQRLMEDPWDLLRRWEVSTHTDLLYRRMLFSPNYCFTDHANSSYELTLGKDREAFRKEEISRQEREKEKEIEMALQVAVVPYEESMEEEVEEDDDGERAGSDGFFGWVEMEGVEATVDSSHHSDEEENVDVVEDDTEDETAEESDWDEIDAAEMESDSDPFDWARKFLWSEGEHPLQNFENVAIVSVQTFIEGVVLLTSHSIYFHQTGDVIDVMTKEKIDKEGKKPKSNRRWKLNQLTDVHGRRYMMKAQGLELFFSDMQGLFLKFNGVKDRDSFHSKLRSICKVPLLRSFKSLNPRTVFKKSMLTDLWLKRRISNFQYIMALNLMAGRTFNDICQYPVFPWILTDYQSETLDLNDPSIYRDLSKPVGALNPDRLAMLIERYNDLDGFPEEQKFLYGSHYSSPGVVLHYMLRQEPFTSMHIALQSGRFDCPDRLFFDLAGCWRSCLTSTSDVKELIPEFFTCPEIFTNTNNFPLGETQDYKQISNVELPPWAKGSPHEFVRIHRLALESEYVSRHLHHWIDLIFGYKQRGPASSTAHNVFHYYSYEGSVDLDKITDDIERKAIEGHIQNFGQTPSQLITKLPHPERLAKEKQPIAPFASLHAGDLKVHTPAKQFGGPKSSYGAILSLHAIGDSVFVLHSDFTLCSYKLNATRNNVLPVQIKADKCRTLENCSILTRIVDNDKVSNEQRSRLMFDNDSFALTMGGNYRAADHGADSSLLLLSCDAFENVVKIHSIETLQLQRSVSGGHRGSVNCIQVSEDGALMVTGGDDATCRVWVIEHDALATAITDGYVSSLGLDDDEITCAHVLFGHVSPITCVAICSKLDVVVSGSKDGSICIHNIRSGKFVRSLHVDAVTQDVKDSCARNNGITPQKLVIHMDGSFVAYFSDGTLMVITINGQCTSKAHVGEKINAMMICHESEVLITGGELGSVRVRTLNDLVVKCTLNIKKYGPITTLALTSDPNFLCVGSSNGFLSVVFRNIK